MTAGLRGSSSGMPASTLPTRSAPTSAPLVKMPPPRRAKMEISEAPKPSATSATENSRAGKPMPTNTAYERKSAGYGKSGSVRGNPGGRRILKKQTEQDNNKTNIIDYI